MGEPEVDANRPTAITRWSEPLMASWGSLGVMEVAPVTVTVPTVLLEKLPEASVVTPTMNEFVETTLVKAMETLSLLSTTIEVAPKERFRSAISTGWLTVPPGEMVAYH